MVTYRAFDEIIDFIASGPSPEQILALKPSTSMQNRVDELLEKKREAGFSESETREVKQLLMVEHIMRLARARARVNVVENLRRNHTFEKN